MGDNAGVAELKTKPTDASARDFLAALPDPDRRRDCRDLLAMMEAATGEEPRMWGASIVGFGSYDYRYASGRSGTWFRAGFASRKNALTVYLMMDLDAQADRLASLGRHKRGKGCLYIRRLADIDRDVLRDLIQQSCDPGSDASCCGTH